MEALARELQSSVNSANLYISQYEMVLQLQDGGQKGLRQI